MKHRCGLCGRFISRFKEDIGIPLSTGFPPDMPMLASSIPYAPFVCRNHRLGTVFLPLMVSVDFKHIEYQPVYEPLIKEEK